MNRRISHNCCEQYRHRNYNRGFTLIELLVVIAIIAVLLAILVPGLRMARAVSKKMACQSNLRQLAVAWNMYLEHYNGYFYQGVNANAKYGGWKGMIGLSPRPLNRFASLAETIGDDKSAKIFCCPADKGGVPGPAPREKAYRYLGTSYQTNLFLIGPGGCVPMGTKTKELELEICNRLEKLNINKVTASSAHLVLIGDQGWVYQWKLMTPAAKLTWETQYKPYAEWHVKPDSYNLAFMDGHTAFVKIRRACYVTDDYSVLPFKDLYSMAYQVQGEEP
jgi:prepilin-type N-terminal cleavage/methylation domain-containing protein